MTSIQHDLLVGDNPTIAHWENTGVITDISSYPFEKTSLENFFRAESSRS